MLPLFLFFLFHIADAPDIGQITAGTVHQHVGCRSGIHEQVLSGIGNGHGKSAGNGHGQKCHIGINPSRKAEGNVGQSADRRYLQFVVAVAERGQAVESRRRQCPYGTDEAIDDHVFPGKAGCFCLFDKGPDNAMLFFDRFGKACV